MVSRIGDFFKKHTPAGRYISAVEKGTEAQKRQLEKEVEPNILSRFFDVVAKNNISPNLERLLSERY